MKRAVAVFLACLTVLSLSGCGSLFDKEYVSIEEYALPTPAVESTEPQDKISVSNYSRLKTALLELVRSGKTDGTVVFSDAYDGNIKDDLASTCWQVRTQDALCAYCVENISYELSKIVTYYEARITVKYAESTVPVEDIVKLTYTSGLEEIILDSIKACTQRIVVLAQYSSYTADSMENLVADVYYENPTCALRSPWVTVNIYRGSGMQRLYDITFVYGYDAEEAASKREALEQLEIWNSTELKQYSDSEKALKACEYLVENCTYTTDTNCNTAFSALLDGAASSEGLALAYTELCKKAGIECKVVSGQRAWQKYYWNMICIDGEYYHVDVSDCIMNGVASGFLLNDEKMWSDYRWDMSAYPSCDGSLTYRPVWTEVTTEIDENNT